MKKKGKDLILSDSQTGSGHFACATTCNVTTDCDFIETCPPDDGSWKEYVPTILSWSASAAHLLASYANYKYFRAKQQAKAAITVRFYDTELEIFYKGQAYIKSLDLTGDVKGLAKMSVQLQPSGPLEAAEENDIEITHSGGTWLQRFLVWHSQSKLVSIEDPIEYGEQDSVLYKEIDVSTKMRTRFYIREGRMLLRKTAAQTATILNNYDSDTLNHEAVIPLYGGDRHAVLGPGKYTVLVNYETQDGHEEGAYMSSF